MRLIVDCRVERLGAVHRIRASAQRERQRHEIAVGEIRHHHVKFVQTDEVACQTIVQRDPGGGGTEIELNRQRQDVGLRSEEHTSELQSLRHLVCRLLLEKKKKQ